MRTICRTLVTTLVLLATLAPPIMAQVPRIDGPQPSRLTLTATAEATTLRAGMMRSVPPNHWKRGALIGGGILTALFVGLVAASSGDCGRSPCPVVAVAIAPAAFLLGALPGSMIGSFFPRDTL